MAFVKSLNDPKNRTSLSLAALAALLLIAGCGSGSETRTTQSRDIAGETVAIQMTEIPVVITAPGQLEAETSIMVSTRMMGWVKKIHIVEGQHVAQGDPLLTIDDSDLQAKKKQAEAGIAAARAVLANAEKMAERFENLYAEKSVSKAQLDDVLTGREQARAGLEMAEAGLAEVKVHLSYLDITAPVDGTVARKMIEEGNMANPGMPLLILEQTDRIKVVAHVGEKDVSGLSAGDAVTVNVTSLPDAVYESQLTNVISAANPGSRTYDVEAHLDNSDGRLKSGMFARVTLPIGKRRAVTVPAGAVIRRGQLTGVWTIDANRFASLRWVRLGRPAGAGFEVLSGLNGDETLVLKTEQPLREGDRVVK